MKIIDRLIYLILAFSVAGLIYFSYILFNKLPESEDPRDKEYLSLEIKRGAVAPAARYLQEKKLEEALLFLTNKGFEKNPFGLFMKGKALFETGRKAEGLELVIEALQGSSILYDHRYPNNIRAELEALLKEIHGFDEFNKYRHFIQSKLMGGCG